jgi:hypothetical protein
MYGSVKQNGALCCELYRASRSCYPCTGSSWVSSHVVVEVVRHDLYMLLYYVEKSHSALIPGGCPLVLDSGRTLVIVT